MTRREIIETMRNDFGGKVPDDWSIEDWAEYIEQWIDEVLKRARLTT